MTPLSDEALQAADKITLRDLLEASVDDRTGRQTIKLIQWARINLSRSRTIEPEDADLLADLNSLCYEIPKEVFDAAFAYKGEQPVKVERPEIKPLPKPILGSAKAQELLHEYIAKQEGPAFKRGGFINFLEKCGPWSNDCEVDTVASGALNALKTNKVIDNIGVNTGTWLVLARTSQLFD